MDPQQSFENEIQVGEIVGYRAWQLSDSMFKDEPDWPIKLESLNGIEWPVDTPIQAKCGHNYGPPGWECQCGIYAFEKLEDLVTEDTVFSSLILGSVLLWGTIIKHENGYRAQYAKIRCLYETSNKWETDLERVAAYYKVPLMHIPTTTEIISILTRNKLRMLPADQRQQILQAALRRKQQL